MTHAAFVCELAQLQVDSRCQACYHDRYQGEVAVHGVGEVVHVESVVIVGVGVDDVDVMVGLEAGVLGHHCG